MTAKTTTTTTHVEKAPARGQRISRQPWRAWDATGRYLGIFRTKRDALYAAECAAQPDPEVISE